MALTRLSWCGLFIFHQFRRRSCLSEYFVGQQREITDEGTSDAIFLESHFKNIIYLLLYHILEIGNHLYNFYNSAQGF